MGKGRSVQYVQYSRAAGRLVYARMGRIDVVHSGVQCGPVVLGVLAVCSADSEPCDLEASAAVDDSWECHSTTALTVRVVGL